MENIFLRLKKGYLDYRFRKSGGQAVYYIKINGSVSGFFALLRMVVDYCCYADENGMIPYIKYDRDILYAEKGFFLGTDNPFEYYFEQPIAFLPPVSTRRLNLVGNRSAHAERVELDYNRKPLSYLTEETYIERMSEIYGKYIRFNARTSAYMEKTIRMALKGKRTLGVHIRGTDFYKEFHNHPVPVTVDEYLDAIKEEIGKHHYEQVFVATDDARCLKELRDKIQVPLVYYRNTMRAVSNKSVAFERNRRKNNNYLLGIEVLKDAHTLAACDGFVGCLSQIDIFVQVIKRSRGQKFHSLNIINKGILMNNRQCWEPAK